MALNRVTDQQCVCCGQIKNKIGFKKISNPYYKNGLMPICNQCAAYLLQEYIKKTSNDAAGLWCFLAQLGIPFYMDEWLKTQEFVYKNKQGRKPSLYITYLNYLEEDDKDCSGFWLSDKMLNDFIEINQHFIDNSLPEVQKSLKENEQIWGRISKDEDIDTIQKDYTFLNDIFQEYTKDIDNMDISLTMRYRDLCKAELRKRKADENGDIQEISRAQDNLKKMYELLGLNNFKSQDNDERKQFLDRIIWEIENTEPAEEEDESKYKDIAGYEKIYNSFMRSMRNLLVGDRNYPDIPKEEE